MPKNAFIHNAVRGGKSFEILVMDGKIAASGPAGGVPAPSIPADAERVDAGGRLVFPSFIDAHVHLREPGFEYKEDVKSGLTAALHGGFGTVMPMANTSPVNDNSATTRYMLEKASQHFPHGPRLCPVGALSVGLEGKELAPMAELKKSGCVAISNDGKPVKSADLFRHAMEYAATFGLIVIDHCEDPDLAHGWQMNEGAASAGLGLKGQPPTGEAAQVARDILLSEYLGLPVHLAHISCRQSVDLIRWAKARGVKVTAETCPQYLFLDDSMLTGYNTAFKVSPPLRGKADVAALREALADGTIDIMVTDHAPHAAHEKEVPFDEAPCGMIGLESAVPLTYGLVRDGVIDAERFEAIWSRNPAAVFGLPCNTFKPGNPADFFLFDPDAEWLVTPEALYSKSKNSPWLGKTLRGKVTAHWLSGRKLL